MIGTVLLISAKVLGKNSSAEKVTQFFLAFVMMIGYPESMDFCINKL
jgi:hypothetical protein